MTRWTVHAERSLYRSRWVGLGLADVELGDGRRIEHHVIRIDRPSVSTVIHDPERGVLMLYRHRFIVDAWGWEVPSGRVEAGESDAEGAAREALEETGWRPGPLSLIGSHHPMPGLADMVHRVFLAESAEHVGEPEDRDEAEWVEWVAVDRILPMIGSGDIPDGYTQISLLLALSLGALGAAGGGSRTIA